jgi:hypothetical protein
MQNIRIALPLSRVFTIFVLLAQIPGFAQSPERTPAAAAPAVPIHILYEVFFQQVAVLDAQAAKLDAVKAKGGDDLRDYYRNTLRLTPDEARVLRKNAASCTQSLSDHAARALNTIAVLKAAHPPAAGPDSAGVAALPPQVSQLQGERTEIAFGCIESLQSGLSAQTFRNIDVYVRTAVATGTSVMTPPPMKVPTAPLSAGKGEGK